MGTSDLGKLNLEFCMWEVHIETRQFVLKKEENNVIKATDRGSESQGQEKG